MKNEHHKKRKFGKSLADRNNTLANNANTLNDVNNDKDEGAADSNDRTAKRGGHKGGKNKNKKLKPQIDEYFCDAPSKQFRNMKLIFYTIFNMNTTVLFIYRSRIYSYGYRKIEWK